MTEPQRQHPKKRYRFDFVLTVLTGNLSRYLYTRPLVDSDPTIVARWYPIRTWVQGDWLGFLPGGMRLRARHLLDSRRLFFRRPADAVVVHALDTYSLYALWHRLFRLRTVVVNNPDGVDYAGKTGLNKRLLASAMRETSLFVPWSNFTADHIMRACPEARMRMLVLHPGLPIENWPLRNPPPPTDRFRLLFVGGDAVRKGIHELLDAFGDSLHEFCELNVASQSGFMSNDLRTRISSMPHVALHLDLPAGSPELRELFANADAFVLPTRSDLSPWVALEAMATGLPVVITDVGGISDMVKDGETGLIVATEDPRGIEAAVRRLHADPELCRQLVTQARSYVEQNFDARVNCELLLGAVKQLVDKR